MGKGGVKPYIMALLSWGLCGELVLDALCSKIVTIEARTMLG